MHAAWDLDVMPEDARTDPSRRGITTAIVTRQCDCNERWAPALCMTKLCRLRRTPCVSRIPELLNCPCTAQSSQMSNCTFCCHQLGFTRTQTNHVFLLGGRIHGIPRVFDRTLDPNCKSRVAATIFDVSSPISVGHHHDLTMRRARSSKNIKIATNDHFACRISNQISQQTLDVDLITSGCCADVSGQLTNCVLDVRTIQPE